MTDRQTITLTIVVILKIAMHNRERRRKDAGRTEVTLLSDLKYPKCQY